MPQGNHNWNFWTREVCDICREEFRTSRGETICRNGECQRVAAAARLKAAKDRQAGERRDRR